MASRFWQVSATVRFCGSCVALACMSVPLIARAAEPAERPAAPAEARLRAACDALIARAVTRRYGIAWTGQPLQDESAKPAPANAPVRVDLSPATTPAAGIVLQLTGELLDDSRYRDAAMQVARGLASAQE